MFRSRYRTPAALAVCTLFLFAALVPHPAEAQWWKRSAETEQVNYGIRFLHPRSYEPVTAPFSQAIAGERQLVRIALYELHAGELDPSKPLPRGPRGPVSVRCTTSDPEVARIEPERSLIVKSGADAFAEFWFVASKPGSIRIDAIADLGDEHAASTWFGPVQIMPGVVAQPRRLKPKPATPEPAASNDPEPDTPSTNSESEETVAQGPSEQEPVSPSATTNPMVLAIPLPRQTASPAKPSTLPALPPEETAPATDTPRAPIEETVAPDPAPVIPETTVPTGTTDASPTQPLDGPQQSPPVEAEAPIPLPIEAETPEREQLPVEPEFSREVRKIGLAETAEGQVAVPTPPTANEQEAIAAIQTPSVEAEELETTETPPSTPLAEVQPAAALAKPTPQEVVEPPITNAPQPEEAPLPCPRFARLTLANVSDVHLRVQVRVAGSPTPLAATLKPGEHRRLRPGSGDTVWIEAQRPNGEQRGVRLVAANAEPGKANQIPPFAAPWLTVASELADCQ